MVEGVAPMPDLNVEAYVSHRLYERLDDVFGVLGLGDWFMRGENWLWKLYYGGDMHEYNIAPFDDTKNYKNAFVHDLMSVGIQCTNSLPTKGVIIGIEYLTT